MFEAGNTPYVTVDLDQVDQNIRRMVSGLSANGIDHRPHTKTHKSLYFAQRQLALGAKGITVAKISEAEVMAAGGIDDIFIAYPLIGGAKLRRLGDLMEVANISTLVNSIEGASGLSQLGSRIGIRVPVLIDIDGGMNRGGLKPGEPALLFANQLKELPGIEVIGLMYYNGMLNACESMDDVRKEAMRERDELLQTAELLRADRHRMTVLSGGSSYSSMVPESLKGITTARAGTYIFGDASLIYNNRMIEEKDCALRVNATVVSVVDDKHAILDAGSKTLSSDLCARKPGYGHIAGHFDWSLTKVNEEHAFLEAPNGHDLVIGERVQIIPNHCCTTVNLQDKLIGMRKGKMERMITVDARGKNQ